MRQMILAILAVVFVASGVSSAQAAWVKSTVRYLRAGYHRNEVWPWPYICPDRAAARAPFELMVSNGWRRQNLLGPHHFNAEKNTLTTAGELKVRWIMTQAPPDRRSIFVERSIDPEVTDARVAAASDYAERVAVDGQAPQVGDTHLVSEGRPAETVDTIYVRWHESMQPPVLPAPGASSSLSQ